MIKDFFLRGGTAPCFRLSLNRKLVLMMLALNLTLTGALIFLYYQTEKAMYNEFERQTSELSKAIRAGLDEATSAGIADAKGLKDYLKKLNPKGVKEISVISTSDRIISSTNPANIGKWITNRKKELIFKAELGEPVTGEGQEYNVVIPVRAGDKHMGYIHLAMDTKDFSVFLKTSAIRRIVAAMAVFGIGTVLAVFLARRYTKPIEETVRAARSVASGDLSHVLHTKRKDEIGELTRSFNYMVGKLREEHELRERLRKAEHMAGIGQFSKSIAHEIKNPLNFISLSIDHIKERYKPAGREEREKFESLLLNIKKEILRVSRFAEGFLEYGKPLGLNMRKTDAGPLIEAVVEVVSTRAEKEGIEIRKRFDALPELDLDPEFIKTCLYNIVLNAFEAMPGGGAITLSAGESNGRFVIAVEDTGSGLSEEKARRVFEPFFTTKDKGVGLGLALTKRVVEEHGGRVYFKSKEGAGSTVTISIPIKAEG